LFDKSADVVGSATAGNQWSPVLPWAIRQVPLLERGAAVPMHLRPASRARRPSCSGCCWSVIAAGFGFPRMRRKTMASPLIAMTQPNAVILYIGFQEYDTAFD